LVRKLAIQVLQGLLLLSASGIVHCDIKPENLVFREEGKSGIRIIDFGSGCFKSEKIYSYIQSRYYRAPEVILGYDYGCPIDIWSLGCVLAELSIGLPIFPGES
jgi:dual specificity tyrosine-phosphorylation-regulated kinase 2/3/4